MAPPTVQYQKPQAVSRAAANRTAPQRYLNRASGRMETAQAIHNYRAPQTRQAPSRSVTVTSTQRPEQPSLIQMTPGQIEARARAIVDSEVRAERLPFQQRQTQLVAQEAGAQQAHTQAYGQLDTSIGAAQTQQAASAKTFQNVAADMVKRAEQGTPGAAEANEHLGGAPAPGSSLARQQEAARTLLTSIASAAQGSTNTRQQAETDFLTNMKATAAQEGAAGSTQIGNQYRNQEQENANKEAQVQATKAGRTGKLTAGFEGEQAKLQTAAQALGLKTALAQNTIRSTTSTIQGREAGQKLGQQRLGLDERKQSVDEAYKRAGSGEKKLKDSLDIKQKEIAIKKALEGSPTSGGKLTLDKVNELSGEAAKVFNVFRRARENGATPAQIREALTRGFFRRVPSKKEAEEKKKPYNEKTGVSLKQPIWLDVAEQIMQKEQVDAPTKQRLREMGLPDSGWSNHFLGGPKKPQPKGIAKRGR